MITSKKALAAEKEQQDVADEMQSNIDNVEKFQVRFSFCGFSKKEEGARPRKRKDLRLGVFRPTTNAE